MAEETRNVTKAIGFVTVNRFVVLSEGLFEAIGPDTIQFAETFTDESIELGVRSLLRTTLDNHLDQFNLIKCKFGVTLRRSTG